MKYWFENALFYHIYPLGLCDCPLNNDFGKPVTLNLEKLFAWLDHIQYLGLNALYLGPVFESTSHGYDTADYYHVDRRLGENETLADFSKEAHARGIRLVLDGVFNHVGREFWAFKDILVNGENSRYTSWFSNLRFNESSPYKDPFTYDSWNGNFNLVKLNLENPDVKEHLFNAVAMWIRDFGIDGLRLDTADCLSFPFMRDLTSFCKSIRPDFWMMGEVIHGDYRQWVNSETLDSVTNYEAYKGLYSSHNESNYYEIAYSLNRQFGVDGIYRNLHLYTFADNHDVNRVASELKDHNHLIPLYMLLFTIPGLSSIYYGSEWGIPGKRENGSDQELRLAIDLVEQLNNHDEPELVPLIKSLITIKRNSPALQTGVYRQVYVDHQQFAFYRSTAEEAILSCVNASAQKATIQVDLNPSMGNILRDTFPPHQTVSLKNGIGSIELLPNSGRIFRLE
jgi:glycosidase